MKKPKIKIGNLESFIIDDVLKQVKQRKKSMKEYKELNKENKQEKN